MNFHLYKIISRTKFDIEQCYRYVLTCSPVEIDNYRLIADLETTNCGEARVKARELVPDWTIHQLEVN